MATTASDAKAATPAPGEIEAAQKPGAPVVASTPE